MSSEIKPLYALLRRSNIADYLADNEFVNTLIELDLDEDWEDISNDLKLNSSSNKNTFCDAFFQLMKRLEGVYSFSSTDNQEKLVSILISFMQWSKNAIDYQSIYDELKKLDFDKSILKKFATQARGLRERINDNKKEKVLGTTKGRDPKKVFIIHGHDQVALLELEKLLKEEFGLQPVILKDSPSVGLSTIISKFENEISDCEITIALFTPDDMTVTNHARARQNVILELGYVLGRDFGTPDRKIIIIKKGQVEIPSDISGVLYLEYLRSIQELHLSLKKQLDLWRR